MTATATVERPRVDIPAPERSSHARIWWTLAGLLLVVAIVPAVALSLIGSTAYQRLPSQQRVFTAPITAVVVRVSSGDVTIERGAGTGTVVTTSGVHGLTYPTDVEHVVGHVLAIRSSCGTTIFNDRCTRSYVVHVPSGVAVTASSGEGDVTVTGTDRAVSAHSDQGDVTITGGSGTLQASSGQGGVTIIRSSAASVSVQSGQGDVAVDLVRHPTGSARHRDKATSPWNSRRARSCIKCTPAQGRGASRTTWATTRPVIGSSTQPRDKETSPSVTARGDLSRPQRVARRRGAADGARF